MKLYRLYTEDNPNLERLVMGEGFSGATVLRGRGLWQGITEASAIIELLLEAPSTAEHMQIARLVHTIKTVNHQESVLVIVLQVEQVDI